MGIRDWYEKAFLPLGKAIAKLGLSPNTITILSIIIGIGQIYFFYMQDLVTGFVFFIVASFMDIIDGSVARATGRVSNFGKLLDHFADRCVEFELVLGLTLGGYLPGWLGTMLIFSMLLPSYVRARGESVSNISGQSVGFFERKEKLGTLIFGIIAEHWVPGMIYWAGIIVSFFSMITAIQRVYYYYKRIGKGQAEIEES